MDLDIPLRNETTTLFGGLGVDETAAALDVSPRTVKTDWAVARAWRPVPPPSRPGPVVPTPAPGWRAPGRAVRGLLTGATERCSGLYRPLAPTAHLLPRRESC